KKRSTRAWLGCTAKRPPERIHPSTNSAIPRASRPPRPVSEPGPIAVTNSQTPRPTRPSTTGSMTKPLTLKASFSSTRTIRSSLTSPGYHFEVKGLEVVPGAAVTLRHEHQARPLDQAEGPRGGDDRAVRGPPRARGRHQLRALELRVRPASRAGVADFRQRLQHGRRPQALRHQQPRRP